jgi:hypothetical protein
MVPRDSVDVLANPCRELADERVEQQGADWMRGNPVVPGGSLTSKPTWRNALAYSSASFFLPGRLDGSVMKKEVLP